MRVLLTGGSGFIAAHVLDHLLEHGHSVVTTVRSKSKADKIRSHHANVDEKRLSFAIVEDIAKEGAFNDAVVSDPPFEAVIHTASPFHFNTKDVQKDLLDPAIIGTTDILRSIKKNAHTVKRVVVTSSFASIVDGSKGTWPEHTYSEADWNPMTLEDARSSPQAGYRASKTFAEKAAWDFMEKEKPSFTLSTLCPPIVFGPVSPWLDSLDSVNTSNERTRDLMRGNMKNKLAPTGTYVWVDVRDLALMHVRCIELDGAADQRYFVTAGIFENAQIVQIMRQNFPEYKDGLPQGPDALKDGELPEGGIYKVDNSKTSAILGKPWTTLEQSIVDTVKSLKRVAA